MDREQKRNAMAAVALPFLVDHAGGEIEISEEAFDAFLERYGERTRSRSSCERTAPPWCCG